jgi:hypothetical protein
VKAVVVSALAKVFKAIEALREAYPHRAFTIDGRLVGDLGEILAEIWYDITLYKSQQPHHDAETSDGKKVQTKATFKQSLTFTSVPEYYLGLKLNADGSFVEIYNGPGKAILKRWKHRKGIGVVQLSFPVNRLEELSNTISPSNRIPKRKKSHAK